MTKQTLPIVAVVGPTATGKSTLAVALAQQLGATSDSHRADLSPEYHAEIINADAYQLYKGMDIGTAKTPVRERGHVIHHLFDVLDPLDDASVAAYQASARAITADIEARSVRCIVVGGSGLYVRALLDHMDFPGTDPAVRQELEDQARTLGPQALIDRLAQLDPQAAATIDPRNIRRVIRALEVIKITNKPFTANLPRQEYVRPTVQIGIDCNRDSLDARIDLRVHAMREMGLVEEVRHLASAQQGGLGPGLGTTAARAVGYAEILQYFAGQCSLDEAFDAIAVHTKRLARKQMGWFGRDPRVHWLDASAPDLLDQALDIVAQADAATSASAGAPVGAAPGQAVATATAGQAGTAAEDGAAPGAQQARTPLGSTIAQAEESATSATAE